LLLAEYKIVCAFMPLDIFVRMHFKVIRETTVYSGHWTTKESLLQLQEQIKWNLMVLQI